MSIIWSENQTLAYFEPSRIAQTGNETSSTSRSKFTNGPAAMALAAWPGATGKAALPLALRLSAYSHFRGRSAVTLGTQLARISMSATSSNRRGRGMQDSRSGIGA